MEAEGKKTKQEYMRYNRREKGGRDGVKEKIKGKKFGGKTFWLGGHGRREKKGEGKRLQGLVNVGKKQRKNAEKKGSWDKTGRKSTLIKNYKGINRGGKETGEPKKKKKQGTGLY